MKKRIEGRCVQGVVDRKGKFQGFLIGTPEEIKEKAKLNKLRQYGNFINYPTYKRNGEVK